MQITITIYLHNTHGNKQYNNIVGHYYLFLLRRLAPMAACILKIITYYLIKYILSTRKKVVI